MNENCSIVDTRITSESKIDNTTCDSIIKKAVWSLSKTNGISHVEILDKKTVQDLENEENNIVISGKMNYENRGLKECMKKEITLCLFCNGFIEEQTEISMIMVDDYDNVVGNNVPDHMIEKFKERTDVIWLSENFVLYPYIKQRSESHIVIMPVKFHSLANIPEIKNPISFYPSVTSDILLKKRFMTRFNEKMCTLIVGFDMNENK